MALDTRDRDAVDRLGQILAACVDAGATGVYELVAESPAVIYLVDGALTYAESGSTPGLGARLVAAQRLSRQEWTDLLGAVGASQIRTLLIQAAIVTEAELAAVIRSATIDALVHLITLRGREPLQRAGSPLRSDWIGSGVRLEIPDVLRAVAGLSDQLADLGVWPGLVPTSTGLPQVPVTLSSDEWSVIWRIDGQTTVQELAWDAGLGVTEALLATGRLAKAGLCHLPAIARHDDRAEWSAPIVREVQEQRAEPDPDLTAVSDYPDGPEPAQVTTPGDLPRRGARPMPWDMRGSAHGKPRLADAIPEPLVAPDPELLRRVLARLKELG